MIALLKGLIESLDTNSVLLDVNGVGYEVFTSSRTLSKIGGVGEATKLYIHTHVREDHIHLFGFADKSEKEWFTILTTVQGVGAKMGLSILSTIPAEQLATTIAAQDKAILTQVSGVGPKLAGRILTELKDKAGKMALSATSFTPANTQNPITNTENTAANDAVSALVNLGYGQTEAFSAIAKISNQSDEVQTLITLGLKELSA